MSDRADEIAREIDDWLLAHAARPARQHKIAAALRSYGDERLEAAVRRAEAAGLWQMVEAIRSLKSEIQEGKA